MLALLDSLDAEQRAAATAPFDVEDHREWAYTPGTRPGLALLDMNQHQRDLVMALLETGLSRAGAGAARDIMTLDGVLRELEQQQDRRGWERRHQLHYWVRVLGDPAGPDGGAPWAWRLNGHHVAVHLTLVGDQVAGTPQFFGANPATVPQGPRQGWRNLGPEEDLARGLLESLDDDQRAVAVVVPSPPADIATRNDPVADPSVVPVGLRYDDLDRRQQGHLRELVRCYVDRLAPGLAGQAWRSLVDGGLSSTTFAWAGSTEPGAGPGHGHYYAVQGETFLLEYDKVQNEANHVHTVWRDVGGDWGRDLLAAHRARLH